MLLIPSSNGHLAMPTVAPFQWLTQQQQPQPMEITVTSVASNNSVTVTTTTPKKTQPSFIAVTTTAQQTQQQQQQTTIDSFNEKHRDVEEHFKRSLELMQNNKSASLLPSTKDSVQTNSNTITVTQATSTPNQRTLFMPTVQTTPATSLHQQIALVNYPSQQQQRENVTMGSEGGGHMTSSEIAMPTMSTPTKPQNVINNALNIENLIGTSTTSNTVITQPAAIPSSQVFDPSSHEQQQQQQQTKAADIQVATNPFPAIFLAPSGMYQQAATAAATTGLNFAPFISMDPNLLGTVLVSPQQFQTNQAALLQQGNMKLSNEDVIKMLQAQTTSSPVTTPLTSASTNDNNTDASNAVMTMLLQRAAAGGAGGIKPVYIVDNSDGTQQLRSISGSNIIAMTTTMDSGSGNTSNSLSTQISSSQIVPTPMNTDESGGHVMETTPSSQSERRSVHSDISSVTEQVEDHFTRALGNNWQLTQKY